MKALSLFLYYVVSYRFILMFGLLLPAFVSLWLFRKYRWAARISIVLILLFGITNIIWGPSFNNRFLHRNGQEADAVVTSIEQTNNSYNDQPVMRYHVVLRTADGQSAKSTFASDDFNVYPNPYDGFSYPGVNEPFRIRYIPGAEKNFVIIGDGGSVYATRLRCNELRIDLSAAQQQYKFDQQNREFRQEYAESIRRLLDAGCDTAQHAYYRQQLEELK